MNVGGDRPIAWHVSFGQGAVACCNEGSPLGCKNQSSRDHFDYTIYDGAIYDVIS